MIIHMTNIEGLGAVRLVENLLPELLAINPSISKVLTPDTDQFELITKDFGVNSIKKRRFLPKPISRALEVLFPGAGLMGCGPFIVLGDMPIRRLKGQVVLVHNLHLVERPRPRLTLEYFKTSLMQLLFSINSKYVSQFIVQTEVMKTALCSRYNIDEGHVHVIPHPPPKWVTHRPRANSAKMKTERKSLRLFYPARAYPHKNHALLNSPHAEGLADRIESLTLTISPQLNPRKDATWINCVGELDFSEVMRHYEESDALVFLSKAESYGLPLIEAIWLEKPIICPDLPYARSICAEGAIYFDPDSFASFASAIDQLYETVPRGKIQDWSEQRRRFPETWHEVAKRFFEVCNLAVSEAKERTH